MGLARRVYTLLRHYPVLWLPQLAAAIINFFLNVLTVNAARNVYAVTRSFHSAVLQHQNPRPTGLAAAPRDLIAQVAVFYPSWFVQTFLCVAAVSAVGLLVHIVTTDPTRAHPRTLFHRLRSALRPRWRAIVHVALLLLGIYLADLLLDQLSGTLIAYVPALWGSPAWLVLVLGWAFDLATLLLLLFVAAPLTAQLTGVPSDARAAHSFAPRRLSPQQRKWIVRISAAAFLIYVAIQFLWGFVVQHFVPRTYGDTVPFWPDFPSLFRPLFNYALLSTVSVAYAVILQSGAAPLSLETETWNPPATIEP